MYKKRMSAWGFTKHVKSNEKDTVIAKLLKSDTAVTQPNPIRHDKLVRHAKSRAKSGALDSRNLSKIVKRGLHHESRRHKIAASTTGHTTAAVAIKKSRSPSTSGSLTRSPAPPDQFADFDLFLRAMQSIIEKERGEWLVGQHLSPSIIFDSLDEGLTYWRKDDTDAAIAAFSRASQLFNRDLYAPDVAVSRIAYCVSSIVWGSVREPIFLQFAQFMATAALEALGPKCPLTIVLQRVREEQNLDAQLAIWACALHGYQVTEQNLQHWWSMAQRRWRWCLGSKMTDTAAGYKLHALIEVRRINMLTKAMELEAERDFGRHSSDTSL